MLHTLAVKDMMALGLNSVLRDVIAEPTNGGFTEFLVAKEPVAVALAAENQVGVASHLAHTGESDKNMLTSPRQDWGIYPQTKDIGIVWSEM